MNQMKESSQSLGVIRCAFHLVLALILLGGIASAQQQVVGLVTAAPTVAPTAAKAAQPAPSPASRPASASAPMPGLLPGVAPFPLAEAAEGAGSASFANAGNEGVKIHGHWVIDVRNPDGTLAEHRDFENSLQTNGAAVMVGLLSGQSVPSDAEIFLQSSGTAPCTNTSTNGTYQGCVMVRSLTSNPGSTSCAYYLCSASLTTAVNYSLSTESSNSIVYTGSITANQTGTVTSVSTYLSTCSGTSSSNITNPTVATGLTTTSPTACTALTGQFGLNALTAAGITAINVTSGQYLQVIVTLTFS